ncbi:MAG: hypothetical protein IT585_05855 [candidate division Zixibacteria bacterium]|nr:hypothetical protein [candidate division Zixibacteria bacterium]
MALTIRDVRHLVLFLLILAALPMLVYPNTLGFGIGLTGWSYVAGELLFFLAVSMIFNRDTSLTRGAAAAVLIWAGRIAMSGVFCLFLMGMERVAPAAAWSDAYLEFPPAVYLFTLTAPFVFNSTVRSIMAKKRRVRKHTSERIIIDGAARATTMTTPSAPVPRDYSVTAVPQPRPTAEFLERTFQHAVQHVGEYSGVLCAMLIDGEGLPVAGWSRGRYDQEMWSALARKIVDDVNRTCAQGGTVHPQTLEFKTGQERFYLQRVADMWLLSIADAASDELEKIRVHQAVDMVLRHLQDRYRNLYMSEAGRSYAGSTV